MTKPPWHQATTVNLSPVDSGLQRQQKASLSFSLAHGRLPVQQPPRPQLSDPSRHSLEPPVTPPYSISQRNPRSRPRPRAATMFFFGNFFYIGCLLINAVAILSEDRFLARISLSTSTYEPGFGTAGEPQSVQAKLVHLIASVRTLMRTPLIVVNLVIILYELILG